MNRSQHLGRDRWRQIIEGQRGSGLTVAAYCLERGITEGSFYSWKRRLRSSTEPKRLAKPMFVEVTPGASEAQRKSSTIEIGLRGDRCLRVRHGFDRELLIELIHALEATA